MRVKFLKGEVVAVRKWGNGVKFFKDTAVLSENKIRRSGWSWIWVSETECR